MLIKLVINIRIEKDEVVFNFIYKNNLKRDYFLSWILGRKALVFWKKK